jgi:hypothetical protein
MDVIDRCYAIVLSVLDREYSNLYVLFSLKRHKLILLQKYINEYVSSYYFINMSVTKDLATINKNNLKIFFK